MFSGGREREHCLTENRVKALKATQTKYGTTNVWTSNGRIFYKCNNKVHKV